MTAKTATKSKPSPPAAKPAAGKLAEKPLTAGPTADQLRIAELESANATLQSQLDWYTRTRTYSKS